MIVCLCKSLGEEHVQHAVAEGAHTLEALAKRCGAGTDCGLCLEALEDILAHVPCGRACADCPRRRNG